MPSVILLGTLDTKGPEYAFLRDELAARNIRTTVIDAGVLGEPSFRPDIDREEVARTAGVELDGLVAGNDRGAAVEAMSRGAASLVRDLHEKGEVAGIIGLGGTGGTTLITAAMRALPVGVPKLMVSTVASGDTRAYVGATDISMMYSVVDIAGINKISRRILSNAAGAIAGMATPGRTTNDSDDRPLIGATMFGVTTPCVQKARELLEAKGYEVLVFHATGTGGQSMEALVDAGMLVGILDTTTTELADELVGGVFSAGPTRLTAAGRAGIPQVVSLGALDMVNFGPRETVPSQFEGRNLYKHNASITLMRTTPQECAELGKRLAERLSAGSGLRKLFIPLRGVSLIATEGQVFHDPDADKALIEAIKAHLSDAVELHEVDTDINDPAFAAALVDALVDAMSNENQGATNG
ncbi:Tm-1-like ATP-binding domain-containing protein [Aquamicrobium sp. NLF2-7]|uniref:Tm-1-like ATP-binding domain-containing protein n=1 Tax=Aquamicrobium sp. NLF2-7 TaxID=2918753 RepID=UPI001EFB645B|nr:Tm-1-like ATP-binding domain-containing protein [Aquamicrobium sp. NLF2-7]